MAVTATTTATGIMLRQFTGEQIERFASKDVTSVTGTPWSGGRKPGKSNK
jgi:hypothetical protein